MANAKTTASEPSQTGIEARDASTAPAAPERSKSDRPRRSSRPAPAYTYVESDRLINDPRVLRAIHSTVRGHAKGSELVELTVKATVKAFMMPGTRPKDVDGWIKRAVRAAKDVCVDKKRRAARRPSDAGPTPDVDLVVDPRTEQPEWLDLIDRRSFVRLIDELVATGDLQPEDREMLELHAAGMSLAEIARELDESQSAAQKRWARVSALLREHKWVAGLVVLAALAAAIAGVGKLSSTLAHDEKAPPPAPVPSGVPPVERPLPEHQEVPVDNDKSLPNASLETDEQKAATLRRKAAVELAAGDEGGCLVMLNQARVLTPEDAATKAIRDRCLALGEPLRDKVPPKRAPKK